MIRGSTRIAAVIGWPVEHSRSPQMFEAAFAAAAVDAVMVPIGIPPESVALIVAALRAMRALGASVTVPHKLAAADLCDELSPAARDIGAVNCVRFGGDGVLFGDNTDCHGFTDSLVAAGFAPAGKRCVILGAGGAARAVAYGLRTLDVSALDIIARRPQGVAWTTARPWTAAELRGAFARADLVVDATSMGLTDDATTVDHVPLDALRSGAWIATLVYHRKTELLQRARARGHAILDGRGMLVHQGARAFSLWTGEPPPIAVMRCALDAALDGA